MELSAKYRNLITKLENSEKESKQYVINESSENAGLLSKLVALSLPSPVPISNEILKKVTSFPITHEYSMFMYEGVQKDFEYKFDGDVMLKDVMDQILDSIDNDEDFNSSEIIKEAIRNGFNDLTGLHYNDPMTASEFNFRYRDYVLGAKRKFLQPQTYKMVMLAKTMPFRIKYIDFTCIGKLTSGYKASVEDLDKRIKNEGIDEDKKKLHEKCINCLFDAVKAIYDIYKSIRATIILLLYEYDSVFKKIIQMSKTLNRSDTIDESAITELGNSIKDLKLVINTYDQLNESGVKTESLSESLESINSKIQEVENENLKQTLNFTEFLKDIGIISKFTSDFVIDNNITVHIYKSINKPIENTIRMVDRLGMFVEVFSKELKPIKTKELLKELIPSIDSSNIKLSGIRKILESEILEEKETITPNISTISDNIIEISDLLTKLNKYKAEMLTYFNLQMSNIKDNLQSSNLSIIKTSINNVSKCVIVCVILNIFDNLLFRLGRDTIDTFKYLSSEFNL